MAVVKMQKLSVCASKKHRKEILEALQKTGAMEIRTRSDQQQDGDGIIHMDTAEAVSRFEKTAESFDKALHVLAEVKPEIMKGGGLFGGPMDISEEEYEGVIKKRDSLLEDAYDVLRLDKERAESLSTISKDENQILSLAPWKELPVPMNFSGTRETKTFIGTLPMSVDDAALLQIATEGLSGDVPVSADVISVNGTDTAVFVIAKNSVSDKVSENLRMAGFSRPAYVSSYVPSDAEEILRNDIDDQNTRISEIRDEIEKSTEKAREFKIASDYFNTRAEKYKILGKLPQTGHVFFLEGWVTAASAPKLEKLLTEKFSAFVEREEKEADEVEPTVLKNNKFAANVEGVLASYGLPQHGKIDPTFIMSLFYVFFFGMMLSDAGYGVVMSLLCLIVLIKKRKTISAGMKKFLSLFFFCGLSTIFWGAMYGGFFGNLIDTIATTFFGYTGDPIVKPLWFDPMSNPMQLLIYCMLFGVIHLFTGLGIKGAQYLKDHDVVGFLCDVCAWYAFLMGLILMLLPSDLFKGISGMEFNFPPFVGQIAKWMTIIGMVVILLMSARGKKNFGLRLALGAYDIYGITSWLSDVLSYSRLLALGLATGVIANVVNMMGAMFGGGGGFGVVIFILVMILGHTLNIAINALGAYVHTNRLQYVEFFGKFYDGGGIEFKPFKTANKFTQIKEER